MSEVADANGTCEKDSLEGTPTADQAPVPSSAPNKPRGAAVIKRPPASNSHGSEAAANPSKPTLSHQGNSHTLPKRSQATGNTTPSSTLSKQPSSGAGRPSSSSKRTPQHTRTPSTPSSARSIYSQHSSGTTEMRPKSGPGQRTRTLSQGVYYLKELRDPHPLTLSYMEDSTDSANSQAAVAAASPMSTSCYSKGGGLFQRPAFTTANRLSDKYCLVQVAPKETVFFLGKKLPQHFSIHPEWSSEKVAIVDKEKVAGHAEVEVAQLPELNPPPLRYPFPPRSNMRDANTATSSSNPLWPRRCHSVPRNDYKNPITWEIVPNCNQHGNPIN